MTILLVKAIVESATISEPVMLSMNHSCWLAAGFYGPCAHHHSLSGEKKEAQNKKKYVKGHGSYGI